MDIITDFSSLENLLLPFGCKFSEDAREVINCWESKEILACPGSGKTTVLIAKLKLIIDQLPFSDGRGVCVLSHTNIAVEELKKKLGKNAEVLLSYPHFMGTIQTFIDKYVAFPYLRQFAQSSIQVVSDEEFYKNVYRLLVKERKLLEFLSTINKRKIPFNTFLKQLYIENGNLGYGKRIIAKNGNEKAITYQKIIESLHFEEGIITYHDAYIYAFNALNYLGDSFCNIISNRFAYTFVDEYQDCSIDQQEILNKIFLNSKTVYQKIGDIDQAIYQAQNYNECSWNVNSDCLSIAYSNRYGQEIADVLTLLRTGQENIISSRGYINISPTLLVYNDNSKSAIILAFINEIKENNLLKSDGIYKAIGMVENVTGLKISDYWKEFKKSNQYQKENNYFNFIDQIIKELNNGNLYLAECVIRKLLCRIFFYLNKRENEQKYYTSKTIKKFIDDNFNDEYIETILELTKKMKFSIQYVDEVIKSLLVNILGKDELNRIPNDFMQNQSIEIVNNTYHNIDENISIVFDTVHGVKGETHDATLYLETEIKNGSDIQRIMKLQEKHDTSKITEIFHKSRKCVYVGWSRPKSLLCVAIREKTYEKNKDYFKNWKIVKLY